MNYETHTPIGELVRTARTKLRYSQDEFARISGVNVKTLRSVETRDTAPLDATRDRIEETLGWRPGVMRELWENRNTTDFSTLTPEDLREEGSIKVTKASDLSDEELTAELAYRLRQYREQRR